MNEKLTKGFSMIELMIGMALGMVIVGGLSTVYLAAVSSSSETLEQSKLNQELTTLMSVMSNDIMRAGINGSVNYSSPQSNPFSQIDNTALEVIDDMSSNTQVAANSASGGECIVYSYDANFDGAVDDADIVGFRLNNGAVEMRRMGDVTANTRHDSCDDSDDSWLPITDSRVVTVTNLNFSLANSKCLNTVEPNEADEDSNGTNDNAEEMDCYNLVPAASSGNITVETRQVDITLDGKLVADNSVTATLSQSVRVRNDLIRVR